MRSHSRPDAAPSRGVHLGSTDGTVDVSSIIVGAVLAGLVVLGISANTLGLLPWGADMQAKQDLAAIRTAEATVAAQGGEGLFQDLDGLEERDLLSDVDRDRTEVATFFGGRQYMASVRSDTGRGWFVTSENPSPRLLEEPPAEPAEPAGSYTLKTSQWASEYCTPEVIEYVEWTYMHYADESMVEVLKMMNGLEYDEEILNTYFARYGTYPPEPGETEEAVIVDALWPSEALRNDYEQGLFDLAPEDFPAAAAEYLAALDRITVPFCQEYPGPKLYPAHDIEVVQQAAGSTSPAKLTLTLSGEGSEKFNADLSVKNLDPSRGYPEQEFSTEQTYGLVGGVPTWTLTITPGPSGWVEGGYLDAKVDFTHVNGSPMWKPYTVYTTVQTK